MPSQIDVAPYAISGLIGWDGIWVVYRAPFGAIKLNNSGVQLLIVLSKSDGLLTGLYICCSKISLTFSFGRYNMHTYKGACQKKNTGLFGRFS